MVQGRKVTLPIEYLDHGIAWVAEYKEMPREGIGLQNALHHHGLGRLWTCACRWVEENLASGEQVRKSKWTESVVVGNKKFRRAVKSKLGLRTKERRVSGVESDYILP